MAKQKLAPPPLLGAWQRCLFQRPPELCCVFNADTDDFMERDSEFHFRGSNGEKLQLFSYTMRNMPTVTAGSSHQQIAFGLNYIFNGSHSNLAHDLMAAKDPPERRLEAIRSIYHLYSDFLRHTCAAGPPSGQMAESALDTFCYMIWDVSPLASWAGIRDARDGSRPLLAVLERVLYIPHYGCISSVLHGLGHMRSGSNHDVIAQIIDKFLGATPSLDPKVRAYAEAARSGHVL